MKTRLSHWSTAFHGSIAPATRVPDYGARSLLSKCSVKLWIILQSCFFVCLCIPLPDASAILLEISGCKHNSSTLHMLHFVCVCVFFEIEREFFHLWRRCHVSSALVSAFIPKLKFFQWQYFACVVDPGLRGVYQHCTFLMKAFCLCSRFSIARCLSALYLSDKSIWVVQSIHDYEVSMDDFR